MTTSSNTKKIVLVDGYALIYRSYFAFIQNPLINSKGLNISSLFGFARMMLRIIQDQKPDALYVAMDSPKKTFRHQMYEKYKANRQTMPEDLQDQIPLIKQFLEIANVPTLTYPGMEADDIMGSLARKWADKKNQVYLLTGDKDAYQLVTDNVTILAPQKGISEIIHYDPDAVQKKLEIPIAKVIDYMALIGDTSDNIPGVKGIGPKTAVKLLTQYESVEDIYDHIDHIRPTGVQSKLAQNKDMAFLSKKLVTIENNLDLNLELTDFSVHGFFQEKTHDFFHDHGMPSIAQDISNFAQKHWQVHFSSDFESATPDNEHKEKEYILVQDKKAWQNLVLQIKKHQGPIALDTETTSQHPMNGKMIGFSVAMEPYKAYYVSLQQEQALISTNESEISLTDIQKQWPELWHDKQQIFAQNYKYDYIIFSQHKLMPPPLYLDTMIASYLLAPGERRHNLDNLARVYLNEQTTTFSELTKKGNQRVEIQDVPIEEIAVYAAEDADVTLRVGLKLAKELTDHNLWNLYETLERPLVTILAQMEICGIAIDTQHFQILAKKNLQLIQQLEKKIYELAG